MTSISAHWQERLLQPPEGWRTSQFQNGRGAFLHYALSIPAGNVQGHVMYVEGLNEFTEKTYELAKDFNSRALGFSVFDRLGQGRSPRLLSHPFKIHSEGVDHDVDDVINFAENVIPFSKKITLLGHSTGGLISLMAYRKRPDLFTPPVITAPLLGIKNAIISGRESIIAALLLPPFSKEAYIPGGHDWRQRGEKGLPLPETYSSHPERMKLQDEFTKCDPALRAGDPTMGWVWHVCKAIVAARDKRWLQGIGPITIFSAGQDKTADNRPLFRALSHLTQADHFHIASAKHEMPYETDDIRHVIINQTVQNALKP